MFGLFKSEPFLDSDLGELRRSGGYWRGWFGVEARWDISTGLDRK